MNFATLGSGPAMQTRMWIPSAQSQKLKSKAMARGLVKSSGDVLCAGHDPDTIASLTDMFVDADPDTRDDILNGIKDIDEKLALALMLSVCARVLEEAEVVEDEYSNVAQLMMKYILQEARKIMAIDPDADLWICRMSVREQ